MSDSSGKQWMRAATVAGALLVVLACLLACGGGRPAGTKGRYPAPTTRLHGDTADRWGERAKDVDVAACINATQALKDLKAEGIPFLLSAAEAHKDRHDNCGWCLSRIDPKLVDDADLDRVAAFLDDRYSGSDGANMSIRGRAIHVLGLAGGRGLPYLSRIKALAAADPRFTKSAELAEKRMSMP